MIRSLALVIGILLPAQTAPAIRIDARALRPGEVAFVTIQPPANVTVAHAELFEQSLPLFRLDDASWRATVGIDLDVKPGNALLRITLDNRGREQVIGRTLRIGTRVFPTRRLRVSEAFVNPPADVQDRIASEAAELDRLWHASAAAPLWMGAFVPPVPQPANSAFGTRSIFNGQARSPHAGADFPSPAGTPVHAPGGGRVVLARELYYTGNSVVIDHGAGLVSLFAHLSRIDVTAGDHVETGTILGLVGATGRVTGPHLHWSLRAAGARVDPLSLVALSGR